MASAEGAVNPSLGIRVCKSGDCSGGAKEEVIVELVEVDCAGPLVVGNGYFALLLDEDQAGNLVCSQNINFV